MINLKYCLLLIPCFILLLACSKKPQNREIISMEELLGENSEASINHIQNDTLNLNENTFQSKLTTELSHHYQIQSLNKQTLFDRFSFNQTIKSTLKSKTDTTVTADLFVYHFSDSAALYNAFNNWLDCFGKACVEIDLLKNKKGVDEEALWCEIYDTTVVIIKFTPLSFQLKNELKSDIFKAIQKTPEFSFEVDDRNELKWR